MKKLSLKKQFNEAKSYLEETKPFIFLAVTIFIFGTFVGFTFQENLAKLVEELLKELLRKTLGLNTFELTFFILQNNIQSALLSILGGAFFGIFPLMSNITNGVILGYVLSRASEIEGIVSWWRLLPHGIFELPAIFISFGIGMRLGFVWLLPKKNRWREFKKRFYNSINVFLIIIIPLLIIAAIIEGILIGFLS